MLDIKTLETWLWDAACSIRGSVDAPKFKDYILPRVRGVMPEGELGLIRKAIQRGQLTGSNRFEEEVSMKIGRRIEFRGQGRPKKQNK